MMQPDDYTRIQKAMNAVQVLADRAEKEHMRAFSLQMREKLGVASITLEEPYLPVELSRFQLQYLLALDRLEQRLKEEKQHFSLRQVKEDSAPPKQGDEEKPLKEPTRITIYRQDVIILRRIKQRLDELRQRAFGIGKYIWRTSDDDKVRASHAANDDKTFDWNNPPPTGHPGSDYGCRCSAEPVAGSAGEPDTWRLTDEQIAELVNLLISLTPQGRAAKIATAIIGRLGRVGKIIINRAGQGKPPLPPKKPDGNKPQKPKPNPLTERPKNVPKDWIQMPSKKKDGTKYVDPKNKGNDLRIQKGSPNSRYFNQRKNYVRWKKNGQWLDKYGKPSNDPEKTHIPLNEFNFELEIFK